MRLALVYGGDGPGVETLGVQHVRGLREISPEAARKRGAAHDVRRA